MFVKKIVNHYNFSRGRLIVKLSQGCTLILIEPPYMLAFPARTQTNGYVYA